MRLCQVTLSPGIVQLQFNEDALCFCCFCLFLKLFALLSMLKLGLGQLPELKAYLNVRSNICSNSLAMQYGKQWHTYLS